MKRIGWLSLLLIFMMIGFSSRLAAQNALPETITGTNASQLKIQLDLPVQAGGQDMDMQWSPDGRTLAIAIKLGAQTFDLSQPTDKPGAVFGKDTSAKCVDYVPDRSLVVTCGSASAIAWLWDRHTGEKLASLANGSDTLEYARFSPNGRLLAIINGFENGIYIWGVNSGADAIVPANARTIKMIKLLDHDSSSTAMSFSPDGSQLATISIDRTLRIWDLAAMKVKSSQTYDDSIRTLAFSPDGQWLAIGLDTAKGSQLKLLNLSDASITRGFKPMKALGSINDVNFSPDGKLLVSAQNDGAITIWDVHNGEAIHTIDDVTSVAMRAAFNRDNTLLATLNFDQGVRIWGIGDSLALIPKPSLAIHAQAFVTQALNMRVEAGTKAVKVMQLTTNTIVTLVDGPTTVDNLTWWKVRTANGVEGWVAESVNNEETLIPDN